MNNEHECSRTDRDTLRHLAGRVAEIAALPEQEQKRQAVKALNRLDPVPPRIYCFPEGAWLECIPPDHLQCRDPLARAWEFRLRMAIYTHEVLADDQPLDAVFNVPWDAAFSGCGLEIGITATDADQRRTYYLHPYSNLSLQSHAALGAVHHEAPLKDKRDIARLQVPVLQVDHAHSTRWMETAHALFDGILQVRRRCHFWQTVGGICQQAVLLRGMDVFMLDMLDDPAWVSEYVGRLADLRQAMLDQLESAGVLGLNNGCEWVCTGGIGYSDELPAPGFEPAQVRCADIWGGEESQDLVGISPDLYANLFFPHLQPVIERFGLASYGCCEPLHNWIPILKTLRNLRRVAVSPWADVAACAKQLGSHYILCRKPLPTPLTLATMDENAIRASLRADLQTCREHDCRSEIIMKDLHSVRGQPQRLQRWVELARETRDQLWV